MGKSSLRKNQRKIIEDEKGGAHEENVVNIVVGFI